MSTTNMPETEKILLGAVLLARSALRKLRQYNHHMPHAEVEWWYELEPSIDEFIAKLGNHTCKSDLAKLLADSKEKQE